MPMWAVGIVFGRWCTASWWGQTRCYQVKVFYLHWTKHCVNTSLARLLFFKIYKVKHEQNTQDVCWWPICVQCFFNACPCGPWEPCGGVWVVGCVWAVETVGAVGDCGMRGNRGWFTVVITASGARHLHGTERHGTRWCRGCILRNS